MRKEKRGEENKNIGAVCAKLTGKKLERNRVKYRVRDVKIFSQTSGGRAGENLKMNDC